MRRDRDDDPFDDIFRELERFMNDMVEGQGGSFESAGAVDTHVDVHEYDEHLKVVADLPGVEKSDIDLKCDGSTLSIRAASEGREYAERVELPVAVDEHSASATYNNGVLEVTFERADDSADIDVR